MRIKLLITVLVIKRQAAHYKLQGVSIMPQICAVILAGGEGKRMGSDKPKTLSEVAGKPMLQWIIDSVRSAGIKRICVVTGSKHEYIDKYLDLLPYKITTAYQAQRLGTGHAVMTAREFILNNVSDDGDVIILGGDAPFIGADTITGALNFHRENENAVTVISSLIDEPFGYGRIIRKDGILAGIIEEKALLPEQKSICEVNSGAYCFNGAALLSVLDKIQTNSVTGEYYLTDAVELLIESGKRADAYDSEDPDVILGANDPEQLRELNDIAERRFKR